MNILYVCDCDPRKNNYGGAQRTHLLWNALKRIGEVYTFCYYIPINQPDEKIQYRLSMTSGRITKKLNDILEILWDFFLPDINAKYLPNPYSILDDPYKDVKFDLVVCRYMQPAARFHLWNRAPLIVDIDDHPIEAFKTRDRWSINPIKRYFSNLLLKYMVDKVESNMVGSWISNIDHKKIIKNRLNLNYLPNIPIYPSLSYDREAEREEYIFFVGLMNYKPNYMGVDEFIETIWTTINPVYPNLKFYIAGNGAPEQYVYKWSKISNVSYLGYVKDITPLYEKCLAAVVPINRGSGTCIKTLEAMVHSRICLSTTFGIRGILQSTDSGYEHGLLVYNNATNFLEFLKNAVYNVKIRGILEKKSYDYVSKDYSINRFNEIVENSVNSVVSTSPKE